MEQIFLVFTTCVWVSLLKTLLCKDLYFWKLYIPFRYDRIKTKSIFDSSHLCRVQRHPCILNFPHILYPNVDFSGPRRLRESMTWKALVCSLDLHCKLIFVRYEYDVSCRLLLRQYFEVLILRKLFGWMKLNITK